MSDQPTLYREATRDEIAMDDLGIVSAVDVYTMDVVPVEPSYEAAAMLLFERLGYVGTPNPELFSDVKDAVDAAIGEPT